MQDFEKLGVFYLGRICDVDSGQVKDDLLLYDSKDLVTHGVCVGMTGSGKTGLCLSILEEAAIDKIPAIAIDPKGDLANLLLTFPELRPQDFEPWVNPDEARTKGLSTAQLAAQEAEAWKKGLAEWGETGDRIRRLRDATDLALYTPGSNAGLGLSMLKSFAAPPQAVRSDAELLRGHVTTAASGLLALLSIEADPLQSREHILLANILSHAWQEGQDLDLGGIIQQIQSPPIQRVGVVDLESFFPAKERFAFAMQINNLVASPGFAAWMEGEPLDVGSLLFTPAGKPRIAVISIAHLGDAERMFVVSLLLGEVLNWVRTQSGTTSLRALFYMDEIAGYFPPVANPPSKAPLLTLMKQARAFGLGVLLATQNPVDLDYKGLSNAGTWFIGRLQTERDKARVLEGLEGAAQGQGVEFDRSRMEKILAGLGKRKFLMNNVHETHPVVFQVRWSLSYLRGPLTRPEIQRLCDPLRAARTAASPTAPAAGPATAAQPAAPAAAPASAAPAAAGAGQRPLLPPDVPQCFLPLTSGKPAQMEIAYRPLLIGIASAQYTDNDAQLDFRQDVAWLTDVPADASAVDWDGGHATKLQADDFDSEPLPKATYAAPPGPASKAKNYETWKKRFAEAVCRGVHVELLHSPSTGQYSKPGEAERDFRIRIQHAAREQRDTAVQSLREKHAPKIAALQERIRRAEQVVEREETKARQGWVKTAISVGASVLTAFLGRKSFSAATVQKVTTAARGASQSMKESGDVARAKENAEALEQQLTELNEKLQAEVDELKAATDPATETLEKSTFRPKKANVTVKTVSLAWAPCAAGQAFAWPE